MVEYKEQLATQIDEQEEKIKMIEKEVTIRSCYVIQCLYLLVGLQIEQKVCSGVNNYIAATENVILFCCLYIQ